MPQQNAFNLRGLNLRVNPLIHEPGDLVRAVNVEQDLVGALRKRPGITTFLTNPDTARINHLSSWAKNDGTTPTLYRNSGSLIYYSLQGTADWAIAGNGTITNNGTFRHTVLNDTLIGGDGVGSTRHTVNGTAFTDTSLAPIAPDFEEYQQRVYAIGTASTLFLSTTGDATNWSSSGTSDSTSFDIPGEGKLARVVKLSDRIVTFKNSGLMHRWDGNTLVDLATKNGLTSPASFSKIEGYGFLLNRLGIHGTDGGQPEVLSNAIQSQIYNRNGNGIAGTTFNNAPGVAHQNKYYLSVGTVTDDLMRYQTPNCVIVYDYQNNLYHNWQFAIRPTAFHSYTDENGAQQMIMGDSAGQVYKLNGTATSDNGTAIPVYIEGIMPLEAAQYDKSVYLISAFFNPGNEANMQVCLADTFSNEEKKWTDIGDCSQGVNEFRLPADKGQGKLLYWRVSESSKTSNFVFFGFAVDYEVHYNR